MNNALQLLPQRLRDLLYNCILHSIHNCCCNTHVPLPAIAHPFLNASLNCGRTPKSHRLTKTLGFNFSEQIFESFRFPYPRNTHAHDLHVISGSFEHLLNMSGCAASCVFDFVNIFFTTAVFTIHCIVEHKISPALVSNFFAVGERLG
jgi:hypothetical protein